MKIWATVRQEHRILSETVQEFSGAPQSTDDWGEIIASLCHDLDLARPVILKKHENDLRHFSRAVFKAGDFMESISFDRFEVEIFPEEKKKIKQ